MESDGGESTVNLEFTSTPRTSPLKQGDELTIPRRSFDSDTSYEVTI